jgi:hypothetical protein
MCTAQGNGQRSAPLTGHHRASRLAVTIVGTPSADSDAALVDFLRRFLETERPGTSWHVSERTAA